MEIWKDIIGFEGLYEVSSIGRIKTKRRSIFDNNGELHYIQKEKIMKTPTTTSGYSYVGLRKNGKSKIYFVHRLVAFIFITNHLDKPFVNHINGVKTDNRIENLEWVTKSENEKHAYKNLGKKSFFKDRFGSLHPKSIKVIQKKLDGEIVKIWDNAATAKEYGFCNTCIGLAISGKLKKHRGFIWERYR